MDRTPDILFAYLRDILYHPERAELSLDVLPQEYQKLGMGLQLLSQWVCEYRDFAKSMARGELSKEPPEVDNILAAPLKELQGALRHLSWQTQQVAKGDFSQRVDFMGEFSEAFNTMTSQLAERTAHLVEEKQRADDRNTELRKTLELMQGLANHTHNMIYVISGVSGQRIYQNYAAQWFDKLRPEEARSLWCALTSHSSAAQVGNETWEFAPNPENSAEKSFYRVETYPMQWGDAPAVVHMVTDNTQQKKQENLYHNWAYVDALTGLGNRRAAMEQMDRLALSGAPFILTIVDVDYLKYCNDRFGHEKGDEYLKHVAMLLKTRFGAGVCRVGGDEFYIIEEGTRLREHDEALTSLRALFIAEKEYPYPHSFSFASQIVAPDDGKTLEQSIREIDRGMYEYKKAHKNFLVDCQYKDDRLPD